MGLAEMLGWTPVSQFIDPRRNALLGMAAGLTSGQNWSDGLGRGFSGAAQGAQVDREIAEKAKADALAASQTNQTKAWLQQNYPQYSNLPPEQGFRLAMEAEQQKYTGANGPTSDIQNYEYSLSHPGFTDFQTQKGGPAEMSLQPTWMRDANGNWFIGAQTKDGRVQKLDTPEGMSVVPPADVAGAKAGATVDAKTAANARAALPAAQQQRDVTLASIDKITNNQAGLGEWFGQVGPRGIYVNPGSQMGNFVADFSQAESQAFLQARQFLKGQGAITETESAKAEGAYSRMAAAKQMGDMQTFLQAASDFRQAVIDGYAKLEATAQGAYGAPSQAAPAGGGAGDVDSILSKYGL